MLGRAGVQRITVTLDDELLSALDRLMARSNATNRSEALRELLRLALRSDLPAERDCIGVMSYVIDPSRRNLGQRVPQGRQARHDATVAALAVPLDHDSTIEVAVMRGRIGEVEAYANSLFLERGVRHGSLSLIPVRTEIEVHEHGGAPHAHPHFRVLEG
jgi:CopG family transcriptional regulator, nickel-responsive regulator